MSFPGTPARSRAPRGTTWVRVYDPAYYPDGASFRHYGPHRRGRWDHHEPGPARTQARGVLYVTSDLTCAVAETFGDRQVVDARSNLRLAWVRLRRTVELVDVRGRAALELGHPAGALRARDRTLTQGIAREVYDGTRAGGIVYEGWFTGDPCIALWERCAPDLELVADVALSEPHVLRALVVIAAGLHYAVQLP